MKKTLVFLFALVFAIGCNDTELVQIIKGNDGLNGANGHSLVSQYVETCSLECHNGGSRLDIYLDNDDSLSVSEGDSYQNSLIACNGSNGANGIQGITGEQGPQGETGPQGEPGSNGSNGLPGPVGPQGPQGLPGAQGAQGPAGSGATVTVYSSSSCVQIAGTSYYAKSGDVYDDNDCHSWDRVAQLTDINETFWLSSNKLGVNAGSSLRVLTFN